MFAYRQIPILTADSFHVPELKSSKPKITVFELATKTMIPVQDVYAHLPGKALKLYFPGCQMTDLSQKRRGGWRIEKSPEALRFLIVFTYKQHKSKNLISVLYFD